MGPTYGPGTYPLKNAAQSVPGSEEPICVSVLAPDLDEIEFSTYLGGSNSQDTKYGYYGKQIGFDSTGNLYCIVYTTSADFPVVAPIPELPPLAAQGTMLCKYNRSGALVLSTSIGAQVAAFSLDVDAGGTVLITAIAETNTPKNPIFNRPAEVKSTSELLIIDTNTREHLVTSWIPFLYAPLGYIHENSIFLCGLSDDTQVQATPGWRGYTPPGIDFALVKLDSDFLWKSSLEVQASKLASEFKVFGPDTLWVDDIRRSTLPGSYQLRAVLRNPDSTALDSLTLELTLPPFLRWPSGESVYLIQIVRLDGNDSLELSIPVPITADSLIEVQRFTISATLYHLVRCSRYAHNSEPNGTTLPR